MKTLILLLVLGLSTSVFASNDLLVLHCEGGATLNLCHDNFDTNPFYGSVDYLDGSAGLVPLATLQNYDCVFTWNNYQYTAGQGDILADYVDGGGTVVICGWAITQCYGRIVDDANYCPMAGGGNQTTVVNLVAVNPHDIMTGVSAITGIGFWVDATMESGAYLIAENSLGTPLAAINANESVIALNMVAGDYISWTGDGWLLMNNSIEFLMTSSGLEVTTWGDIKASF